MRQSILADHDSPQPVTLTGHVVRLEPLSLAHAGALLDAAQSEEIWQHTLDAPRTMEAMQDYIARALVDRDNKTAIPFAVQHRATGGFIGCTRYVNIAPLRRGLEIGYTWYAPEFWRTAVNTECKYLLLAHAFEGLRYIRVELQTMSTNARSRAAILRLGAIEEGVLRSRMVRRNGERFDSIFFSILDHEWPMVKTKLEGALKPGVRSYESS
jgi:RimJ/RimL family protein N-acetyltransferase